MPGPLLCVVYVNNLDENLECMISKFPDYTRVGGIVYSEDGCQDL